MRWRISYSPAAAERSNLGMRLTVCPTLNLCITILSILISGCYISLARATEALSKSAHSVGFLLIILDREETARARPATEVFAAPSAQLGGCRFRKLDSCISMVQPAKDRMCNNISEAFD